MGLSDTQCELCLGHILPLFGHVVQTSKLDIYPHTFLILNTLPFLSPELPEVPFPMIPKLCLLLALHCRSFTSWLLLQENTRSLIMSTMF